MVPTHFGRCFPVPEFRGVNRQQHAQCPIFRVEAERVVAVLLGDLRRRGVVGRERPPDPELVEAIIDTYTRRGEELCLARRAMPSVVRPSAR
jgi:hypothetical protein